RTRHAQIGILDERLAREEIDIGLRGTRWIAERRVLVDQLFELTVVQLIETRLLRVLAVRGERHRLRQIDLRGSAATTTSAAATTAGRATRSTIRIRLGANVPEPNLALCASALREARRR